METSTVFRRRLEFLVCLAVGLLSAVFATATDAATGAAQSLNGDWQFAQDRSDRGVAEKWFGREFNRGSWRTVRVPHTWQIEPGNEEYVGVAWYARHIDPDSAWAGNEVRLEFDAVYRDARVWINGVLVGEHNGSGWTPFGWTVTRLWDFAGANEIVVRVDNRPSAKALPYLNSLDWAIDGGIIRAVRLRALPFLHVDGPRVHAEPASDFTSATVEAKVTINNASADVQEAVVEGWLFDPGGKLLAKSSVPVRVGPATNTEARLTLSLPRPELWHFDQPRLHRFVARLLRKGEIVHERETTFGIRRLEVKEGRFILNGERMRLMGVEWMPGSDPRYGMAEGPDQIRAVLADLKQLNCLLTRFHWQQDDAVFEFCDREGILVQEEVPAWGGDTMKGQLDDVQAQQTREMILAHGNHPSIFAWGLCNEIGGQRPEAHAFVSKGRDLARALDPRRLLAYASNSLQDTPERDASALLDFLEWNEYYESWYRGNTTNLIANLERIRAAYPDKGLIVSEYGLCECDPKNPSTDARRVEILRTHTDRYRRAPNVAGAIFFDYNDYRTLIGDKGQGAFRQRVHGVVDLLGRRKPSWDALRKECSPVRSIRVRPPQESAARTSAQVEIVTRSLENDFPAYTLRGYRLFWIAYNELDQPLGTGQRVLADLAPGSERVEEIDWPTFKSVRRVAVEIFRPTGYSVSEAVWNSTLSP